MPEILPIKDENRINPSRRNPVAIVAVCSESRVHLVEVLDAGNWDDLSDLVSPILGDCRSEVTWATGCYRVELKINFFKSGSYDCEDWDHDIELINPKRLVLGTIAGEAD